MRLLVPMLLLILIPMSPAAAQMPAPDMAPLPDFGTMDMPAPPGPSPSLWPLPDPMLDEAPASTIAALDDYDWVRPGLALPQTDPNCASCYPGPAVSPFPVPKVGVHTAPSPDLRRLPGDLLPPSDTLELQLRLLDRMSEDGICGILLTRVLLQPGEQCSGGRFSSAQAFIQVFKGGEALPVYDIWMAGKSSTLAKAHQRGFEAHRYYLIFVIDPRMGMNMLLFDYEPLLNRSDDIKQVLDRFQHNTEYIEVSFNEGIVSLTTNVRVAVSLFLSTLAG